MGLKHADLSETTRPIIVLKLSCYDAMTSPPFHFATLHIFHSFFLPPSNIYQLFNYSSIHHGTLSKSEQHGEHHERK